MAPKVRTDRFSDLVSEFRPVLVSSGWSEVLPILESNRGALESQAEWMSPAGNIPRYSKEYSSPVTRCGAPVRVRRLVRAGGWGRA